MYEPRSYRRNMGEDFVSFICRYLETDIWVAINKNDHVDPDDVKAYVNNKIHVLRKQFEDYFLLDSEFKSTLKPYKALSGAPDIIQRMVDHSFKTGVGPMAGIAGAFSEEIATSCKREFGLAEIMIENGGDNYLDIQHEVAVQLYAGSHPLSNKIRLQIEPADSPLGLCASSGKFGHSRSFGTADLVSVACRDTILADQYATALANQVTSPVDVEKVLEISAQIPEILHCAVFMDDTFGIRGRLKVRTQ